MVAIPTVPVKFAVLEIVWSFIKPEVIVPVVSAVENRLVDDAVVLKKLVVVALVPVAVLKVKAWRVVEPVTRKLELMVDEAVEKKPLRSPRVVEVETP